MLTKAKVIASMDGLPETFSVDEIIDRIILIEKIERGLDDVQNGKTISDKDLDKQLSL